MVVVVVVAVSAVVVVVVVVVVLWGAVGSCWRRRAPGGAWAGGGGGGSAGGGVAGVWEEACAGGGVGGVGGGEFGCGDDAGVGLGDYVGLVAVAAHRAGLAGVAGLGVHHRDHPARRHAARYAHTARHLRVGLCVLARDRRQQLRRLCLLAVEAGTVERVEHRTGVADQIVDQPRPLVGVAPVT